MGVAVAGEKTVRRRADATNPEAIAQILASATNDDRAPILIRAALLVGPSREVTAQGTHNAVHKMF